MFPGPGIWRSMRNRIEEIIQRQSWMEPLENRLQQALRALWQRSADAEALLHGRPLGHPLHVMLTDLPLGAWTVAELSDLFAALSNSSAWTHTARASLGIGVAGALAAAIPGLADWSRLEGTNRRLALIHGLLNVTSVAIMTASMFRRPHAGKLLSLIGYALTLTSARLGGELVYGRGVGVATLPSPASAPWHQAAA